MAEADEWTLVSADSDNESESWEPVQHAPNSASTTAPPPEQAEHKSKAEQAAQPVSVSKAEQKEEASELPQKSSPPPPELPVRLKEEPAAHPAPEAQHDDKSDAITSLAEQHLAKKASKNRRSSVRDIIGSRSQLDRDLISHVLEAPAADDDKLSTSFMRRISRELAFLSYGHPGYDGLAYRIGGSQQHIIVTFEGPKGTVYDGGVFYLLVYYPSNYPRYPLYIKFLTEIYHPNIDVNGDLQLRDLDQVNWSPICTLGSLIVSITALLTTPHCEDAILPTVATEYVHDRDNFDRNARQYTEAFAGGERPTQADVERCYASILNDMVTRATVDEAEKPSTPDEAPDFGNPFDGDDPILSRRWNAKYV